MTVELVLLRHGRTASNAAGLLLGRADVPLDEEGERQAAAAAAVIGTADAVVASPLVRARATAEAVGAVCGAAAVVDDRLIELDYGEWDRRPVAEVGPEEWAAWRADPSFAPPGGESLLALGERVRAACVAWAERGAEQGWERIVMVSHVSPIKASVAWALGVDDAVAWRTFLANGSISRVAVSERGPALHSFNETMHLR